MKNIASALLKAQQSIDPIHKGKKGYGYTYADLPAVLNAVLDVLNENGIVVVQSPEKTDKNAACIVTRLIHADSGEEISSVIEVPFELKNFMFHLHNVSQDKNHGCKRQCVLLPID